MPVNALQLALKTGTSLDYIKDILKISVKEHPKYPNLLHFSYSQIESPMDNPIVQDARGTILDSANDWAIVCWGYRKFFNFGEPNAHPLEWNVKSLVGTVPVEFYEKVDGSLCMMYFYDNDIHVATTGSPDAGGEVNGYGLSFAELFWKAFASYYDGGCMSPEQTKAKLVRTQFWNSHKIMTLMFEVVSPMNQVVVQYDLGLRFLGGRYVSSKEIWLHNFAHFGLIPRPKRYAFKSLQEAILSFDHVKGHEMEGYVAVDPYFNRVKIKHPGYLVLHKAREGLSGKGIMEQIQQGDSEELISYFPQFKEIHDRMKAWYLGLATKLDAAYENVSQNTNDRKSFALAVKALDMPFKNLLFSRLDGKSILTILAETNTRYLVDAFNKEEGG